MSGRIQYWIPTVIFLISFYFHLILMSKGPVTVDCLNLVIQSQSTIETHHLQYLFGSGYPLMVLLGSVFITIGKYLGITDPVTTVNFISVLLGSIAIPVFYLLVQRICNDALTSVLASFILLFNPLFLDACSYGINHAPALCFLLLGLLSLLRFQTSENAAALMISALYFGLMGAVRLQDFILAFPAIACHFILNLQESPNRHNKHKGAYFFLFITMISLIIILFHLPYFFCDHTGYAAQAKDFWKIGLSENFRGLFSKPLIRSLSYLTAAFSLVGIVCFGAGLLLMAKFNKKLLAFVMLWGIVPLGFYGDISAPRFLNILLPAVIIPISVVLAHMLRHKRMLWRLVAMISSLLIILIPLFYTHQTFIRRHHYALIPDYYRWVGQLTAPDATIISSDDSVFITYYSKRNTLLRPVGIRHLSPNELNGFKNKLDTILKNKKPVYITNSAFILYDHYHEFSDLMQKNYHLIQIGKMPLELWYITPFNPQLHMSSLIKVEKKGLKTF